MIRHDGCVVAPEGRLVVRRSPLFFLRRVTGDVTPERCSARLGGADHELAYYTIANASFFLGTVALLNSLRRVGERAPLVVVDCGLTAAQRQRLSTAATVVPRQGNLHPLLQKATGPLVRPAEIMVYIDADILVTRPLDHLVDEARAGQIVGFEDSGNPGRFFDAWSSLGLGEARRRTYVNGGFFALSLDTAREFLPVLCELQLAVDIASTHVGGGSPSHPLYFLDQDLLNAMYCTRFDGRVTRLERKLAPFQPFDGVELSGNDSALCSYADGVAPFLLHHTHRKPWLASLPPNVYSELFTMLVTDPQACLPLDPRELPLRLSNRPLAGVDRWRASKQHATSRRLRGKVGILPRIARLRARTAD